MSVIPLFALLIAWWPGSCSRRRASRRQPQERPKLNSKSGFYQMLLASTPLSSQKVLVAPSSVGDRLYSIAHRQNSDAWWPWWLRLPGVWP